MGRCVIFIGLAAIGGGGGLTGPLGNRRVIVVGVWKSRGEVDLGCGYRCEGTAATSGVVLELCGRLEVRSLD